MQHPNATAVATLIVAVAEVQSGAPPVRGAGGGEEAEPYNEAANAGHQGDANVQQQLKGLHARVKATEHDLKMRVCRVDWQDEIKAIQTDLQARHALEMRALERSIDNKVQAALDEYKQKNHLEMKILVDTMFAGLVDKTKELTIELGQYKFLLNAKLEEAQAEATENMDSAVKRMTTSSREADMARTTAQAEFEQKHALKICEIQSMINTEQVEFNQHSIQQNHAVMQQMRSHHDSMLAANKVSVQQMADNVYAKINASYDDWTQTTGKSQEMQHHENQKEIADAMNDVKFRLASLEEMQDDSRKPTDHVAGSRREQRQGVASYDNGMDAALGLLSECLPRQTSVSAYWSRGAEAPATSMRTRTHSARLNSARADVARTSDVPADAYKHPDGTPMSPEEIKKAIGSTTHSLFDSESSKYHSGSTHSSTADIQVLQMDSIDRRAVPQQALGSFGASAFPISSTRGGQASHATSFFRQGAVEMQQGAAQGPPRT